MKYVHMDKREMKAWTMMSKKELIHDIYLFEKKMGLPFMVRLKSEIILPTAL